MTTDQSRRTIPIVEEEAHVDKRVVETGRVRVSSRTHAFEETVSADLDREEVEVTRVPVDRVVDRVPDMRTEGDLTIIPVVEEVAFVEARLVLREEIHIRKTVTTRHVEEPVALRRQEVTVERFGEES
jgi:uncharacterized protein (TIGR02271 family)